MPFRIAAQHLRFCHAGQKLDFDYDNVRHKNVVVVAVRDDRIVGQHNGVAKPFLFSKSSQAMFVEKC